MGRIARVLDFMRALRNSARVSDVTVDPGGGPNITAEHYASPGDDSYPMPDDFCLLVDTDGSGRENVAGYLDPLNTPKAGLGEKRIYARDPDGISVVEVWLKADGSAIMSNDNGSVLLRSDGGTVTTTPLSTFDADADGSIAGTNGGGSFELEAGGDFLVNGVKIDAAGNITCPATIVATTSISSALLAASTNLTVNGKEMDDHKHNQGVDGNSDTQQTTTGPI